jgi:hypothetical protein
MEAIAHELDHGMDILHIFSDDFKVRAKKIDKGTTKN